MVSEFPFRLYRGLSTDTKPNVWETTYNENGTILAKANVGNGDEFYEIDTDKHYYASGATKTWVTKP